MMFCMLVNEAVGLVLGDKEGQYESGNSYVRGNEEKETCGVKCRACPYLSTSDLKQEKKNINR